MPNGYSWLHYEEIIENHYVENYILLFEKNDSETYFSMPGPKIDQLISACLTTTTNEPSAQINTISTHVTHMIPFSSNIFDTLDFSQESYNELCKTRDSEKPIIWKYNDHFIKGPCVSSVISLDDFPEDFKDHLYSTFKEMFPSHSIRIIIDGIPFNAFHDPMRDATNWIYICFKVSIYVKTSSDLWSFIQNISILGIPKVMELKMQLPKLRPGFANQQPKSIMDFRKYTENVAKRSFIVNNGYTGLTSGNSLANISVKFPNYIGLNYPH